MIALVRRMGPWVVAFGGSAVLVAVLGQAVVLGFVLSAPTSGEWVLFAIPVFGLLGFVGVGTLLTGTLDR